MRIIMPMAAAFERCSVNCQSHPCKDGEPSSDSLHCGLVSSPRLDHVSIQEDSRVEESQKVSFQNIHRSLRCQLPTSPDIAGEHCSPYASPGLARDHMIRDGLPQEMQMWLCEWDMLLAEGQHMADRFERLGKNVDSKLIPRVPHAWDKSVNPFRDQKAIDMLYTKSAINLNKVFQDKEGVGWGNSMSSLHPTDTIIERQPRNSVVLPL